METKGWIIKGFLFMDEKTAEQARREAAGIDYIKENTEMENPEIVLQLYQKLMKEKLFETPVGIGFLKELRDFLMAVPSMKSLELEPISTEAFYRETEVRDIRREKIAEQNKTENKAGLVKKRFRISLFMNLFLLIVVIGMLVITMTSDRPNIVNYENKLVDKYAQWQQELKEREQTVRQKEIELEITP